MIALVLQGLPSIRQVTSASSGLCQKQTSLMLGVLGDPVPCCLTPYKSASILLGFSNSFSFFYQRCNPLQ